MFRIGAIFHVTIWLSNRKVWALRDWSYGRRNISILDMVLVLAIYSFCIYHVEIAVRNVIFSFLQTIGTANGILFFLPFLQSLKFSTHFTAKCEEQMAYPDPLICLQSNPNMLSSQSQWFCLMIRKNHITKDLTEPVRIILTLAINSYRNTNFKLKK